MEWSPVLPIGIALEGGEVRELDARGRGGGPVSKMSRRREGPNTYIQELAHRSL